MEFRPALRHGFGIGPRAQADEIAVVPVVGVVEVAIPPVGQPDDVRKGAVRGKILVDGHHLHLPLGAAPPFVVEPEHVAGMHTQPRGLRARESHAVRTGQGPEIALGGPQSHGLDEALRHLVEPLVEAEQIAAPADPERLFPAPGTEAAAGLDLGRTGDKLLTLGTRRVERVVRLAEPRAGGHQADAAGIGNVAVEGQFPAHLHQDDVEGREGQCQPDDIEQ